MRTIEISFCVSGHVKQQVELTEQGEKFSNEQIAVGLKAGTFSTSVEGEIITNVAGEVIGKVVDIDNNCEYEHFDVEDYFTEFPVPRKDES